MIIISPLSRLDGLICTLGLEAWKGLSDHQADSEQLEQLGFACRSDLDITSEFRFYHFTSEFVFLFQLSTVRAETHLILNR